MKLKRLGTILVFVLVATSMVFSFVAAEDGLIFRRNVTKTPEAETSQAALYMMDFYVPAQAANGLVGPVDNYILDDDAEIPTLVYEARDYAKPLVAVYNDDIGVHAGDEIAMRPTIIDGAMSYGAFDAFAAVSLDDGTTWKTTNLSNSSDLSSFTLKDGAAFPGDVNHVVEQVAGDQIFVAWSSRYCAGGNPLYKLSGEDNLAENVDYLTDLEETYGKDALYLYDLFGVNGNQGSVDYTDEGFPEVGETPYNCIWAARGKLLPGDDPATTEIEATYVMWTKAERLTSGTRDANLPAVDCVKDAGCILTWQEDPEGLRPGQGLGPGEGWSGAVANAQTDIWYSYISYSDFDLVFDADGTVAAPLTMAEYALLTDATTPKPYVPMAIPTRLTDNAKCKPDTTLLDPSPPYCYIDFDSIDDIDHTNVSTLFALEAPEENSDYCASEIEWLTPGGSKQQVCVTDDGRVLNGRVASTRVRLNLKGYTPEGATDIDGDGVVEKSAWVIMAAEETKALGDMLVDPLGNPAEDPLDIGKDMWYYTFDMFDHALVDQGGILNQPATCSPWTVGATYECTPYEFFPVQIDPLNGGNFYLTEIARRFSVTTNSVDATIASESGLSAMLIFKQGIINQGGPADIFLRRVVYEPEYTDSEDVDGDGNLDVAEDINGDGILDEGEDIDGDGKLDVAEDLDGDGKLDVAEDIDGDGILDVDEDTNGDGVLDLAELVIENPYAYENMECDEWAYTDGRNPNYLKGICLSPAINLSGTTIVECDGGRGNDACADTFPVADDGSIEDSEGSFPKVLEWRQCDADGSIDGCTDNADDDTGDLDDQSWENPFDVAKGHRGFLDGDFVMMMYAWAPNWKANSVGNDHYNLYVRRSFDGGLTWTTTPAARDGIGTEATENYCVSTSSDTCEGTLFTYGAGEFEQGRNVSQLIGNKVTILDPRYSPTGGLKLYPTIRTDWLTANGISFEGLPYDDDLARDPSKFFMIYETGDNTTVTEGEAVPLDLFYSRATIYGDVWELDPDYYDETTGELLEYRWNWAEHSRDDLSGEASMLVNPGGTFMYAVWNQWKEEIKVTVDEYGLEHEEEIIYDSDMWFRRFMYQMDEEDQEVPASYAPKAWIIYVNDYAFSWTTDDAIEIYGTAVDFDDDEIVEYVWTYYGPDGKVEAVGGNSKMLLTSVKNLPGWAQTPGQPGWAKFGFKVKDSDGNWSKEVKVEVLIADAITRIYNPMVLK